MLPIDSFYIYFYVLFAGFMSVWAFRSTTKSKKNVSEFEYIGFSAFWGIALIVLWDSLAKINPPPVNIFSNPLSTGFILSIIGMSISWIVGELSLVGRKIHQTGWKNTFNKISGKID
jgi:cytosine/uracil/thiamine/allantoin permease